MKDGNPLHFTKVYKCLCDFIISYYLSNIYLALIIYLTQYKYDWCNSKAKMYYL